MSDNKYHVRFKGRVLGPFDEEKIRGLIKRGQVTRTHELSPDGVSWKPASEFQELFSSSKSFVFDDSNVGASVGAVGQAAPSTEPEECYAHIHNEHKGPVTKSQLSQWVNSGDMTTETLVWKQGLENWEAASVLVPDLFAGGAAVAGGGAAVGAVAGSATAAADPLQMDRSCPFCAQTINSAAIKCPHCQSMLNSFCNNCGAQCTSNQAICLKCGTAISHSGSSEAEVVYVDEYAGTYQGKYSKQTAGILALLLGGAGAHKFYHGSFGFGILYLVFIFTLVPAILAFIEGIMYLTMSQDEYDQRYNLTPPNPFKW